MCDPGTLIIASTAVAAVGQGYQALAANAQGRYAARVADQNARLAADAAKQSADATRDKAQQHWREVAQLEGQQRVAMAAGGLDVNFGNAGQLQDDTKMLAREDARRIYDQGAQDVLGYDIEGANYRSSAQASRQAAGGALVGGLFSMAGTALGGASQYSNWKARFGGTGRNAYGISGGGIY